MLYMTIKTINVFHFLKLYIYITQYKVPKLLRHLPSLIFLNGNYFMYLLFLSIVDNVILVLGVQHSDLTGLYIIMLCSLQV